MKSNKIWSVPYVDQPPAFWQDLHRRFASCIDQVYIPFPSGLVSSGRPLQPDSRVLEFLEKSPFDISVLINPIILQKPAHLLAGPLIEKLEILAASYRIRAVTVSNPGLAEKIREKMPRLNLTASVLMDIFEPAQLVYINDIFDTLVPSSRILRNIPALKALKKAFRGRIKLIVNEGCLPHCVHRVQHFYEMASKIEFPRSLCAEVLEKEPWLRLTGSWVLPQHLYMYDGVYDDLKLSGRVTLQDPGHYRDVLSAYIHRVPKRPHRIGGGPVCGGLNRHIGDIFFEKTIYCDKDCISCSICRDYYGENLKPERSVSHA